ncbi:MAG: hypothetical protein EPO32_03385 [Anaerolineae bacterium]|nr:MAG: hypothetical protein EPO32_03385 [Anaerolineae bacterium]
MNNAELETRLHEVFASPAPDAEKLALAFEAVTRRYLIEYANEIELCIAMKDEENLLKERIKHGVLASARGMLNHCYYRLTGDFAWKED